MQPKVHDQPCWFFEPDNEIPIAKMTIPAPAQGTRMDVRGSLRKVLGKITRTDHIDVFVGVALTKPKDGPAREELDGFDADGSLLPAPGHEPVTA